MVNGAAHLERGSSADALEALVGALHLDLGFEAARRFVEWLMDDAASVGAAHIDGNYKVRLETTDRSLM
jgi:dsRNA-specific ribonuclease